ncbi:MAG: hypothetical protein IKW83_03585 [Muribaculaceae bacterium]|nr:hypothetical protein [Muribaculaceae bacterium]
MNYIRIIKKHPFGGNYLAINLFGFIFTLCDLDEEELNYLMNRKHFRYRQ